MISLDLSNFDTSNVTDMASMFYSCRGLTELDLSNFDTANVTNMRYMFYANRELTSLNITNFNTSQVTDMSFMFARCSSAQALDLSDFIIEYHSAWNNYASGVYRMRIEIDADGSPMTIEADKDLLMVLMDTLRKTN